jgi:hypothetical protein
MTAPGKARDPLADDFDRDLEAVFEERAGEFSSELQTLLKELYQQGVLSGRAQERQDQVEMRGSKLSECGKYWCTPVPEGMLVLGGAQTGADTFTSEARQRPRAQDSRFANPFDELLANMDAEILETLAGQARAHDQELPGNLVTLVHQTAPRVPVRRPAWEGMETAAITSQDVWMKQLYGNYGNLPVSSTVASSLRSAISSPKSGGSGKT